MSTEKLSQSRIEWMQGFMSGFVYMYSYASGTETRPIPLHRLQPRKALFYAEIQTIFLTVYLDNKKASAEKNLNLRQN